MEACININNNNKFITLNVDMYFLKFEKFQNSKITNNKNLLLQFCVKKIFLTIFDQIFQKNLLAYFNSYNFSRSIKNSCQTGFLEHYWVIVM